jgi:hypothetical protein
MLTIEYGRRLGNTVIHDKSRGTIVDKIPKCAVVSMGAPEPSSIRISISRQPSHQVLRERNLLAKDLLRIDAMRMVECESES